MLRMATVDIQRLSSEDSDAFLDDAFDGDIDLTFPPMRYAPMLYPSPHIKKASMRRESSRERQRLYKELVGHEPYRPSNKPNDTDDLFWVTLDIKHYKPEEVTLKVDGHELVVSGKHYNEISNGYDSTEFQRKYAIPNTIDMNTLTSNITPNGVLCIKATKDRPQEETASDTENTDNFCVSLDVTGYKPDEITIRLHGHNLIIQGEEKKEHKEKDGCIPKTFARHFSLPNDVDIDSVASRYTKDGRITVEAPRKFVSSIRTLEIKEE